MNKSFTYFPSYFYLILLTYFISFIIGENSTGGAFVDYATTKKISIYFSRDFFETLNNYDSFGTKHTPVLPIFFSFFETLGFSDLIIRLIFFLMNLALPVYFYKCLKLKYPLLDLNIKIFILSIIFLSPTFRSLSVWPDSRILGLTFFVISVYFYLNFEKNKKFKDAILNTFFLAISSYISPNFAVFVVFFFLKFFLFMGLNKKIIYLILINIFLSFPAFYFILIEQHNFLFSAKAISQNTLDTLSINDEYIRYNYFNKILLISGILFFYLLPLIFFKILNISFSKKIFFISLTLTIVSSLFFNYHSSFTGGGLFFKLSYYFFDNDYLSFIFSFLGIYSLICLCKNDNFNYLIFILLIASNPQLSIYHKYFDPLIIILVFSILNLKIDFKELNKYKTQYLILTYFLIFLLFGYIKVLI